MGCRVYAPGSPIGRIPLLDSCVCALLCTDIAGWGCATSKGEQHNPYELSDKGVNELGLAEFVRRCLQQSWHDGARASAKLGFDGG